MTASPPVGIDIIPPPEPFDDILTRDVRFRVLGRLEVVVGGRDVAPTAPRGLQVLALLLLRAGSVVPTEQIVEELWGDRPPKRARSSVQTHVYQLRRSMARLGVTDDPDTLLATRNPGYQLLVDPRRIDLATFHDRWRGGRSRWAGGRPGEAAEMLRSAVELWSGPPLANVAHGSVLAAETVELLEGRRAAQSMLIDAEIDGGRHHELVGELRARTVGHPLDELVHAQLIRVLGRCGRRSEAMAVFRCLREVLATELGVEPGAEVHQAYGELLTVGRAIA